MMAIRAFAYHSGFTTYHCTLLVVAALIFWWLSGFDVRVTGENKTQDCLRRGLRCLITLLLVEMAFWNAWLWCQTSDRINGLLFLAAMMPQAFIWAGCLSELMARSFCTLIDSEDKRKFNPKSAGNDLEKVASLMRSGRKQEAIQLCHKLRKSGDAGVLIVETMLEHLGVQTNAVKKPKPLIEVARLRSQGQFKQAVSLLNALLAKEPANADAAFMLVRVYAVNLKQRNRARKAFQQIVSRTHLPLGLIDYMHSSIDEWSGATPPPEPAPPFAEPAVRSIDELLAEGHFGTVTEFLEQKLREHPGDFELWMKFAETHGRYCGNVQRAEKIIQKIEADPGFSPEQVQLARSRLSEWQQPG